MLKPSNIVPHIFEMYNVHGCRFRDLITYVHDKKHGIYIKYVFEMIP